MRLKIILPGMLAHPLCHFTLPERTTLRDTSILPRLVNPIRGRLYTNIVPATSISLTPIIRSAPILC